MTYTEMRYPERYWVSVIPTPRPAEPHEKRITQALRKGFYELNGDPEGTYELADEALAAESILPSGRLAPASDNNPDAERWYFDIPPPLDDMPSWIGGRALRQSTGVALTKRESNL